MSGPSTCSVWRPDECDGTETCPPRCPRFVAGDGTAVLVEPRRPPYEDTPEDLRTPDPSLVAPDDLVLGAAVDGTVRGYVWLRTAGEGALRARLETTPAAGENLRAELARQAAAYGVAEGAERLLLDGAPGPFAAADLAPAEDDDGWVVSLTDPGVARLTTPGTASAGGGADGEANDTADAPASDVTAAPATAAGGGWGGVPVSPPPVPENGPDLSALFAPDQVAVVGATDREGTIGRLLLENLDGYGGTVVPVTPRADEVLGRPAPDSLAGAGDVDLAVVAVPPEAAIEAVETAGEVGVEAAVVVAAGFDEAGESGAEYARRLREAATAGGVALVGPNSMGVLSTASGLNASFAPRHPPRGGVSLVSQSGAFVTGAVAAGADRGLGFRHVVSVGNKVGVDEVGLLRYLDGDPGTDVVAAYLEDLAGGSAFVEAAREVTRSTPVVVLKAGRTAAGASAAASHTGSMAGDDDAVDAALDRAGVLRADSTEQLLDYAAVLRGPTLSGGDIAVVTNAGGPGVLATDATGRAGLALADLGADTRGALDDLLPAPASATNPVDVLGDADADRFAAAADAVLGDAGVDVGLVVTTPHPLVDHADLVAAVGRHALVRDTPVVTALVDGDLDGRTRRALRRYGVANFPDPSRAADAVAALRKYARLRDRPAVDPPAVDIDRELVREVLDRAREAGRRRLGVASLELLEASGIDVPQWELATSPEEAAAVAAEVGGPVVLKAASPDIPHKADVGGVRVDVAPEEAASAYQSVLADVRAAAPGAEVDGVVVQATADVDAGVETVVGVTGSRFGPLVAFGLGGVLVEHVEDVAFALAPLDRPAARRLLADIDAASVLDGARGRPPVDREALADALVRVAALAEAVPAVAELDVNPLVATPDGVTAVDLQVELVDEP